MYMLNCTFNYIPSLIVKGNYNWLYVCLQDVTCSQGQSCQVDEVTNEGVCQRKWWSKAVSVIDAHAGYLYWHSDRINSTYLLIRWLSTHLIQLIVYSTKPRVANSTPGWQYRYIIFFLLIFVLTLWQDICIDTFTGYLYWQALWQDICIDTVTGYLYWYCDRISVLTL